ncbi:unnamed protein product, partial [Durusdinium trenchii]
MLFDPSSSWLGGHRLPFEDSSTFTDLDPLEEEIPQRTSWSFPDIGFMQLSAPPVGDAEQRVHEAIARCLASPLLEVRPEGWWLNPDEDLLETSENIEFLMSALQVQLGRE